MTQEPDACGEPGTACCEADDCRGNSICAGGTCQCQAGEEACGGACVDMMSDAANCGACGHDCLGGECALGVCQPLELAKNQGTYLKLALDGEYVYWAGSVAAIGRARIDGSEAAQELVPAAANEHGHDIVAVGQTLYWGNDWQDNGIRGCALPACPAPKTLVAGATPIYALMYDAALDRLFWNQANVIWSKPLPAGSSQIFLTGEEAVQELVTDADFLYWTEFDADTQTAKIRKQGLDGGGAVLLAGKLGPAYSLSVFGDKLYFAGGSENGVHSLPLPNGIGNAASEQFAPSAKVQSVVTDRDGVFWAQHDTADDGTVRWCPHDGCTGQPAIKANARAWSVLTDDVSVYWATEAGSVFRMAK
jgi:hypothetical protein